MSSIHLRHLPRSRVLPPTWPQTPLQAPDLGSSPTPPQSPREPSSPPLPPAPTQAGSPWRSPGPRPLALPSTAVAPRSPGGCAGRLFQAGPLRASYPAGSWGHPAPANRRETRPGTPAPATLRLPGDPPQAGRRNSAPRVATCPAPSRPGTLTGRGAAQGSSAKGPLPHAHLLPDLPSAPPGHSPFLGHESAGFGPGLSRQSRAGDWLRRPPPPGLRLRRLPGWVSRGASCSEG